jgi:multiple sugar transport system ATP-binding protein
LYEHPNNLFVAGFIGSPAMNFLSAQLDGDRLRTPIGDLRVPDELRQRLESGDGGGRRGVIVGIRPEHFEDASLVTAPARGHILKANIEVLETLGSDYYAHFTVDSERVSSSELEELSEGVDAARVAAPADGVQVVARLGSASAVKRGQEAGLWLDTSQLHLFDEDTGRSLLTSENSRPEAASSRQPHAAG